MEQPPCPGHTGGTCVPPPAQSSPWLQGFRHGTTLQGAVPNPQRDSCPWQRRKLPSGPGAGRGREIPPIQPSDPGAKGRSGGCCRVKPAGSRAASAPSLPVSPTGMGLCQGLPKQRVLEAPNAHSSTGSSTDTRGISTGSGHRSGDAGETRVDEAQAALFPRRNQKRALMGEHRAGGAGSEPRASIATFGKPRQRR